MYLLFVILMTHLIGQCLLEIRNLLPLFHIFSAQMISLGTIFGQILTKRSNYFLQLLVPFLPHFTVGLTLSNLSVSDLSTLSNLSVMIPRSLFRNLKAAVVLMPIAMKIITVFAMINFTEMLSAVAMMILIANIVQGFWRLSKIMWRHAILMKTRFLLIIQFGKIVFKMKNLPQEFRQKIFKNRQKPMGLRPEFHLN